MVVVYTIQLLMGPSWSYVMLYQVTDKLDHIMLYQVADKLDHIMLYQVADKLYHIMIQLLMGPSWSYGSWIYNYLCNHYLSLLKVVRLNANHDEVYSIQQTTTIRVKL
jgi:hypothetical protein